MKPIIIWDSKHKKTKTLARFKMEQKLGRELTTDETVIHIDGDISNNNIENLMIRQELTKQCCICGITEKEKRIRSLGGEKYCSKHYFQMKQYNKIIDPSPISLQDKNKIILYEDHAEIEILDRNHNPVTRIIIDLDDVDKVAGYKWNATISKNGKKEYVRTTRNNKRIVLHRLILDYYGDKNVDHINRNIYDNRKENLRIVEPVINSQNIKPAGVRQRKDGVWYVSLKRFKKTYYLGTFKTKEEAIKVRDNFLEEFHKNENKLLAEYLNK